VRRFRLKGGHRAAVALAVRPGVVPFRLHFGVLRSLGQVKGWRPSACPLARNRFGLFVKRAYFLPDIGSIARYSAGSSVPGLMNMLTFRDAPWTPGSLLRSEAPRPPSWANGDHANPRSTWRQSFTSLEKARGTRNEDQGNDTETRANRQRTHLPLASFKAGRSAKQKRP
jgi:hypothetical protein